MNRTSRIVLSLTILSMFLFPQIIFTVACVLLAYDVLMGVVTKRGVVERLMKPTIGRFLSWCWNFVRNTFRSTKNHAVVVYKEQQYKKAVDPSKDTIHL